MRRFSHEIVCLMASIACLILLASCYRQPSPTPDGWVPTEEQMDSISFYTTHHYSVNYNFVITADSLPLIMQLPTEVVSGMRVDSFYVGKSSPLVVADILMIPADTIDSVWVQVATDQASFGWVHESELLTAVSPDNPISRFIDAFSDTHLLIMLAIVVLCAALWVVSRLYRHNAKIVHFRDIDSFYPTLLALLVSAAAVFYSTIQLVNPESWRHFYYHPTLNPFEVPLHLELFLFTVWGLLIVGLAALDVVRRRLTPGQALLYLVGLAAVCSVDYVVFSVFTLYYVGYPLLLVYIAFALWRYYRYYSSRYVCGRCGHGIRQKGKCPHCGAFNV